MLTLYSDRGSERDGMLRSQLEARDIRDPRVLAAMRAVPRHRFLPEASAAVAYQDHPVPLGPGQTLSQPYIVAYMAQALGLTGGERVLEVGSGCGYFCAVLSLLAGEVFGIELDAGLAENSALRLEQLGCPNIRILCGDGAKGWPGQGLFDAVVLSCAAPALPPPLWEQLRLGGQALFPQDSGPGRQDLVLLTKMASESRAQNLLPVAFVPLR
jgi:protein-L-isoaspartate(D-aspartate) O-methyltransferase